MANPRKFSEKIALHNQKQAEETARFEQIMREVSDATNKVNSLAKQHLQVNPTLNPYRGGSLPNFNRVASNAVKNKTEIPNTLSNFEESNKSTRTDGQVVYRERGRSVGVGPMRARPVEKRIDTSPYGGTYLSPPLDSNWRRTNSDSALHQCTQDVGQRRQHQDSQIIAINCNDKSSEQRPRSCYEDSLVPGINIHPSHNEPGTVQIPIGNNTGSLPDLTSFHFPSPLPTPLDLEDPSNSFSTTPQGTTTYVISPSQSLQVREGVSSLGRFSLIPISQDSIVPSPHSNVHYQVQNQQIHSPIQRQGFYSSQRLTNLTVGPTSPGAPHSPIPNSSLQNHLTVPTIITSSYLHQSKGVTQDHSATVAVGSYSAQKFIYQNPPLSPALVNCSLSPPSDLSPQQLSPQQQQINVLTTYRNSQPNRPSPQSSPGLSVQQYRSASPGDNHNSAPPSPASPGGSPGANTFTDSNYFISHSQQAAALQQHFEQFNMLDSPPVTTPAYIPTPNLPPPTTNQVMSLDEGVAQELGADNGYFNTSPSQLQYNPSGSTTSQQTNPQTPSSIPNIILTDFSSNPTDDLTKPSVISSSFDSDMFQTEDNMRGGLGSIDFDGLPMLTDQDINAVSDPNSEDNLKGDKMDGL